MASRRDEEAQVVLLTPMANANVKPHLDKEEGDL
jgi:hypothetical protein